MRIRIQNFEKETKKRPHFEFPNSVVNGKMLFFSRFCATILDGNEVVPNYE